MSFTRQLPASASQNVSQDLACQFGIGASALGRTCSPSLAINLSQFADIIYCRELSGSASSVLLGLSFGTKFCLLALDFISLYVFHAKVHAVDHSLFRLRTRASESQMADLAFMSAVQLTRLIEAGSVTPHKLTETFLERINQFDRDLNSFTTLNYDEALRQAIASTKRAQAHRRLGPMDGIPVGVKDNIDVAGLPTTNGLGKSADPPASADAEVVHRLREAGAVILGKFNMHESALGATTDNPHHGPTINPHRSGHSPGGSSGGSAAAVAAGLCCAALGTDTGGSVRIPASYCGIVGLKPSYAAISTRGVVPLSSDLDHVGLLTRTVADAAMMMDIIRADAPSTRRAARLSSDRRPRAPRNDLDRLTIGILENFVNEPQEKAVRDTFQDACRLLTQRGAQVRPLRLPSYDPVLGRRAGFLKSEVDAASFYNERLKTEPGCFSNQMRGYLEFGAAVPAAKVLAARQRIDVAAAELRACLREVEVVVSPTTPQCAPSIGGAIPNNIGTFCILANFAGVPAISVPMGTCETGLPVGLQIIGPANSEGRVLQIAAAFEAAVDLTLLPPPPIGPRRNTARI